MKTRIENSIIPIVTLAVGAIGAFIAMLMGFGIVEWTSEQQALVMGFVVSLGAIVSWIILRAKATPISDPKTKDGEKLVRSVSEPE